MEPERTGVRRRYTGRGGDQRIGRGGHFHFGNKEDFDAEVYAIFQALRLFDAGNESHTPTGGSQTRYQRSAKLRWTECARGRPLPVMSSRSSRDLRSVGLRSHCDGHQPTGESRAMWWPTTAPGWRQKVCDVLGPNRGPQPSVHGLESVDGLESADGLDVACRWRARITPDSL